MFVEKLERKVSNLSAEDVSDNTAASCRFESGLVGREFKSGGEPIRSLTASPTIIVSLNTRVAKRYLPILPFQIFIFIYVQLFNTVSCLPH